jgi:septal ring factor EnvC (AmiA/AmiB activator)
MPSADSVVVKDLWAASKGHSKTNSFASSIPTLRGTPVLSTPQPTSVPQKAPQKLRLQNPQKLRERLQNEAKAIGESEASLQNELSKIGEEMAKVHSTSSVHPTDLETISRKIAALESRISELVKDLQARNEHIQLDLEKSLLVSEVKVKGLDQMYKESSAENELLYEKFNAELGKIVKALKGKGKEDKEELVGKLKESTEETAKTKKENARLRRELLTMRALLKANEL